MKSLFLSVVFAMILAISPADTYSGGGDGVPNPNDQFEYDANHHRLTCLDKMECWIYGEECGMTGLVTHPDGYRVGYFCYEIVIRP